MLEKILESTKESLSVAMKISTVPYVFPSRVEDFTNPRDSESLRLDEMIGIALGTASCVLQIALYANLASKGYGEILFIPLFTNLFSYVYEIGRIDEKINQLEKLKENNNRDQDYDELNRRVNEIMRDKDLEDIEPDLDAEAPSIGERATDYYWESLEKNNQKM